MDVRCPACGRAVSEWAARCPACEADVTHAQPVADDRPRRRSRRRAPSNRRSVTVAVVLAALVGTTAVAVDGITGGGRLGRSGRPAVLAGPGSPFPGLVATTALRLQHQRLFVADGTSTEAVLADGTVLRRLAGRPGADLLGHPFDPVVTGGTVVFADGGSADAVDPAAGRPPVSLGPADAALAAGGGRVDLVTTSGGRQFVDPTTVAGIATGPTFAVPAASSVAGLSDHGLVLERPDHDLEVLTGGATVVTGAVRTVVAVRGDEIAWTSRAECQSALTGDCPLHLTHLAGAPDRTAVTSRAVTSPAAIGFAGVGAFSPDGRYLAVYSLPSGPQTAARLDLSVVTVSTGAVDRVASVLVGGPVTPTVNWSPSGEWIFFGGDRSFDALDFAPPDGAKANTPPIPLPISATCCVATF